MTLICRLRGERLRLKLFCVVSGFALLLRPLLIRLVLLLLLCGRRFHVLLLHVCLLSTQCSGGCVFWLRKEGTWRPGIRGNA